MLEVRKFTLMQTKTYAKTLLEILFDIFLILLVGFLIAFPTVYFARVLSTATPH